MKYFTSYLVFNNRKMATLRLPMRNLITALLLIPSLVCFAQTNPSIQFTSVPDWGKTTLLQGRVHNSVPGGYGVAVYINIGEAGGWWTKPYESAPVTEILPDSSFSANIVTGGIDEFATQIIAFLIPLTTSPPVLTGADLPQSLFSYPYTFACRPHGGRKISWSGHEWTVKKSLDNGPFPVGPGPNIFNDHDSMVWVDNQQRLHLRIAKKGSEWHCTELICNESKGYGMYRFDVATRVDLLDPNIIAGIFTWDDCALLEQPPDPYFREIDFEFSRWGIPANKNSQFVIQPWSKPGNLNRFNMNLTGIDRSVHLFDWSPEALYFKSTWGTSATSWTVNASFGIPVPGNENIRINFWLMNGLAPSNGLNSELVLNSYSTGLTEQRENPDRAGVFPNPFEKGCTIDIPSVHEENTEISIFNLQGKIIRTVFRGKLHPGSNRFEWDGKDGSGRTIQPGMYLIGVKGESETRFLKVVKI